MFAVRYPSLNALEQALRRRSFLASWVGSSGAVAETYGRAMAKLDLDSLRELCAVMHRRAWRSKAIRGLAKGGYRVVAVDGHELFSSEAGWCEGCLTREVKVKHKGQEGTVTQYYHRVVVAQWVGVTPPGILDVELVQPDEGEVVAARRLLARVLQRCPRLIDVIVADALYLEAPFLKMILDAGKHFVVVMKQEARELYQDAEGLRKLKQPREIQDGRKTMLLWDLKGLESFPTLGVPVRVVWVEERTPQRQRRGGELECTARGKRRRPRWVEKVKEATWVWVTDLPSSQVPALTIARWGHQRWDIENRCFNELSTLWGMNHCFHHDPTAICAFLLTLALAFLMTYLFHERNLKLPVRSSMTRLTLADRLREGCLQLPAQPLWPPPEPSG